ncbi:MAG TPA: hypothetical protein V6D03_12555 [Candidatus Caenarcaniphilales bacterium]
MATQSKIQKNAAANPSGKTDQTFAPEDNSAKQIHEQKLTVNPGDIIPEEPQAIEKKAEQLAVNSPDITGDMITVPTFFVVQYPNGEKKALHHVRDANDISDVIRQMRVNDEGERIWW